VALRGLLRHSRIQESAADQSGVRFLQGAGLPVDGFMTFMEQLASQELLPESQQSEYVRTHPISQDRVDFLRNVIESGRRGGQVPPAWDGILSRMQAKLEGYLFPDRALLRRGDDVATRYGQTIAWYRKGEFDRALPLIDGLIKTEPKNAYFHELKGQMLFERGRVNDALPSYRQAAALAPRAGLIAGAYGHALVEAKPPQLDEAVRQLQRAIGLEPRQPGFHQFLAIAYGRQGKEGLSRLHLAERSLLQGKFDSARTEANLALNALPHGASRQRALDILDAAAAGERRKKDK
jgi:predicted Zn-dependent protease